MGNLKPYTMSILHDGPAHWAHWDNMDSLLSMCVGFVAAPAETVLASKLDNQSELCKGFVAAAAFR